MAELIQSSGRKQSGKGRRLKDLPKVDLTAMVDLAFLLITFFMLTTTLAKSKAMDIAMPVGETPMGVSAERTMTICLGKNNTIYHYMGGFDLSGNKPTAERFSSKTFRKKLMDAKRLVSSRATGTKKGLIVLVKPAPGSRYENLVDAIDELNIAKVAQYSVADISLEETKEMKRLNIF